MLDATNVSSGGTKRGNKQADRCSDVSEKSSAQHPRVDQWLLEEFGLTDGQRIGTMTMGTGDSPAGWLPQVREVAMGGKEATI